MKFFIVCVLAFATLAASAAPAGADDCSYAALKKCYNLEYMISPSAEHNVAWPKDDAGVLLLCSKLQEGGVCLHAFNEKCAKNEHDKKLLNSLLAALKKHHDSACTSVDQRKQFLDRVSCYTNPAVVTEVRAEHQRYVGLVEAVLGLPKTERKPSVCCAALYMRDAARETDKKHCKPEVVAYLDTLIKNIFASVFHDECGPAKNYAECNAALPADAKAKFNGIVNAATPPATKNSIALPTLYQLWQEKSSA